MITSWLTVNPASWHSWLSNAESKTSTVQNAESKSHITCSIGLLNLNFNMRFNRKPCVAWIVFVIFSKKLSEFANHTFISSFCKHSKSPRAFCFVFVIVIAICIVLWRDDINLCSVICYGQLGLLGNEVRKTIGIRQWHPQVRNVCTDAATAARFWNQFQVSDKCSCLWENLLNKKNCRKHLH